MSELEKVARVLHSQDLIAEHFSWEELDDADRQEFLSNAAEVIAAIDEARKHLRIAEPVHLATEGNPLVGYYVEGRFLPIPDTSWGSDGDEGPDVEPEFYWPPAPKGGA